MLFFCKTLICVGVKYIFLFLLGDASISHGHKAATFNQHVKWKSWERSGAREIHPHPPFLFELLVYWIVCDKAKVPILTDVTFTCGDLKGSDRSHSVALDIHKKKKKSNERGKDQNKQKCAKPNDPWHIKQKNWF